MLTSTKMPTTTRILSIITIPVFLPLTLRSFFLLLVLSLLVFLPPMLLSQSFYYRCYFFWSFKSWLCHLWPYYHWVALFETFFPFFCFSLLFCSSSIFCSPLFSRFAVFFFLLFFWIWWCLLPRSWYPLPLPLFSFFLLQYKILKRLQYN